MLRASRYRLTNHCTVIACVYISPAGGLGNLYNQQWMFDIWPHFSYITITFNQKCHWWALSKNNIEQRGCVASSVMVKHFLEKSFSESCQWQYYIQSEKTSFVNCLKFPKWIGSFASLETKSCPFHISIHSNFVYIQHIIWIYYDYDIH